VGVAKSTLYRWIDSEHFPAPIKIGPSHTIAWDSRTVDSWMLQLIEDSEAERDKAA
jgi:predicted DNA-binding transcriptional regulator AlpA